MLKPDIWLRSEARAEIDHRAREARLRLERLERLLKLRGLPVRSWRGLLDYGRAPRFFRGGRVRARSTKTAATRTWRPLSRDIPTDICVASCQCP
jgi:hypothetical protein